MKHETFVKISRTFHEKFMKCSLNIFPKNNEKTFCENVMKCSWKFHDIFKIPWKFSTRSRISIYWKNVSPRKVRAQKHFPWRKFYVYILCFKNPSKNVGWTFTRGNVFFCLEKNRAREAEQGNKIKTLTLLLYGVKLNKRACPLSLMKCSHIFIFISTFKV